jgi:hypothetical protein
LLAKTGDEARAINIKIIVFIDSPKSFLSSELLAGEITDRPLGRQNNLSSQCAVWASDAK